MLMPSYNVYTKGHLSLCAIGFDLKTKLSVMLGGRSKKGGSRGGSRENVVLIIV